MIDQVFIVVFIAALAFHVRYYFHTKKLYTRLKDQIRKSVIELLRPFEGTNNEYDNPNWSVYDLVRHATDDISSILSKSADDTERSKFIKRYTVRRESRSEIRSKEFDKNVNIFAAIIQIYPPLGILGTITGLMYSVNASGGEEATASILNNFNTAMWTTFAGLILWIAWTIIYSVQEKEWDKIPEAASQATELIWDIDKAIANMNSKYIQEE